MEKNKSVKKNLAYSFIKTLMGMIFPLITFPYASRVLLADGIGQVNYATTVISYFQMIASLGIGTYAITEGAKIRDNKEKLEKFISDMFSINFLSMIISYLLFLICINFNIFKAYKGLLLFCSVSIFFTTIGVDWINVIEEDYQYITIRTIFFQFLSLILLFILVKNSSDVFQYAALNIITIIGAGILNFIHIRKYIKFKLVKVDWNLIKKHLKPILLIFGMSISTTIYSNLDILLLGIMKGNAAVGMYTASVKINHILIALLCSINNVLLPRLSYYIKNSNKEQFNSLVNKSINLILMLAVPLSIGLFLLSSQAIMIISGPTYLAASNSIKILSLNLFLSPINNFFAYQLLMPFRKEKVSFIATTVGAIANVIGNLIFIPSYSYFGAAFTTVISELLVLIICVYSVKDKIDVKQILWDFIKYVLFSSVIIIVYFVINLKTNINNIYLYSTSMVIISASLYFLILTLSKNQIIFEFIYILKNRFRLESDKNDKRKK